MTYVVDGQGRLVAASSPEFATGQDMTSMEIVRNFVNNAQDPSKDGGRNLAYALYVLARNGSAPIGDLRYYADTKLDAFATPIAKAQLAAALALLGDRARADARRFSLRPPRG